jgi:phenylalanyl-tRNA synthetase beta chain
MGWQGIGFEPAAKLPTFLHPGRAASIHHGGVAIGWLGAVHPEFAQANELRDEAVVAELSLDGLIENAPRAERFHALPRHPGITRDISVLCERGMLARDIESWVREAAGPLLHEVTVSDRFEGLPLATGKVSLTLTLRYQDPERTLVGEEIQKSVSDVVRALRGRGAEIRGE